MSKFKPVTAADVTDDKLVAGQLRALQTEVRSGFELITTKLLTAIERLDHHLDDVLSRVTDLERRVAVLETKRRKPARKTKNKK